MRRGHWCSEDVLSSKVWVQSVVSEEVPSAGKEELYSVCCPGNRGHAKHIYSSYLNFYYEVTFEVLLQLIGHRKGVCREHLLYLSEEHLLPFLPLSILSIHLSIL